MPHERADDDRPVAIAASPQSLVDRDGLHTGEQVLDRPADAAAELGGFL